MIKARLFIFLFVSLLATGSTMAHVVVVPKESAPGAYEVFAMRVPNEKSTNTVKVSLDIPTKAVLVSHVQAVPGWKYELAKNTSGDIEGITWTATGPGLPPGEFIEFKMAGKTVEDASEIIWNAHQTYAGGEVIDWTGERNSKTPASITSLHTHSSSGSSPASNLALIWSIGAFFLSFVTLLIILRGYSSKAAEKAK